MTDKTDSHPTVEPAHVSSHILEGTADQSIHNEMYTETELPGEIFDVRGDGHCIIPAAILCLQNAGYDITHVDLCSALVSEVITNLAYYDNFSTDDEDFVKSGEDLCLSHSTSTGIRMPGLEYKFAKVFIRCN